ncbi:hypothetical protein BS47DRAFT_1487693 [Hydnum rufescens UP504]|uniref:Uncharacterized protein n=1 Tax=Hydnum rufescens UP504 TaxID=1448309 RepID=A0A9P6AQU6_9AGAM|nr:hypothetical protein BS47DRAFT_1487693 [Hydnum rufescens UP504]
MKLLGARLSDFIRRILMQYFGRYLAKQINGEVNRHFKSSSSGASDDEDDDVEWSGNRIMLDCFGAPAQSGGILFSSKARRRCTMGALVCILVSTDSKRIRCQDDDDSNSSPALSFDLDAEFANGSCCSGFAFDSGHTFEDEDEDRFEEFQGCVDLEVVLSPNVDVISEPPSVNGRPHNAFDSGFDIPTLPEDEDVRTPKAMTASFDDHLRKSWRMWSQIRLVFGGDQRRRI